MSEITANLVKDLRLKTGAGMMDCKKALVENSGDFEKSIDWLRKKGLSNAAKKSGRVTAEGLVVVANSGVRAAIIEANSETDFVARNDQFQSLATNIAEIALNCNNIDELKSSKYPSTGRNVSDEIIEHIAVIGENISLRRMKRLEVNQGVIASYIHNQITENSGKIGVIVAIESNGESEKLIKLGKQIAMHIAASKPDVLTTQEVDPKNLDREKQIFSEQARTSGKPDSIIEKMVEGRIKKYYEEVVLLEQVFVMDGKSKISEVLDNASKELGTVVKLKDFAYFVLGEGIEQEAKNFADEVKAVIG